MDILRRYIDGESLVTTIVGSALVGAILLVAGFIIYRPHYKKLKDIEQQIREQQKKLKNVPSEQLGRAHNSPNPIPQPVLDKWIEIASAPIKDEIARLEQERRFIIEKMPFIQKLTRL